MRKNDEQLKPEALATGLDALFDETIGEWYEAKHRRPKDSEVDFVNSLEIASCPHCGSERIRRDGYAKKTGLAVRECRDCGRKFTPLTGTLFDNRKIPISEWFEFCLHLFQFHSVMSAAADNRNAYSTGRYWLSKVFTALEGYKDDTVLSGRVYIDETYVPCWPRDLQYKPDGKLYSGLSRNRICIASATDGRRVFLTVAGTGKPSSQRMLKAYSVHIEPGSTLILDGEKSHGLLIATLGLEEERYPTSETKGLPDSSNPLNPINSVHRRLKRMLSRHGGYSRDELPNWLNLIAFDMNTGGSPFDKARELVALTLRKRKVLRYRGWSRSKKPDGD